ncbi:MAG TPA: Fic/DOC family N-terminal domain-containing protein [Candidatus Bathyarchaeia archaeon]|nr:Fic/DOC family N-terminal domain-containing protein [Candidatus Bathyarchaeia archaeon]
MTPYVPEPLPLKDLDWRPFRRLVGPANAALARYDGIVQAIPDAQVLLSPLTTQEAVLSSRIEGTQANLEEVLEFEARKRDPESNNDIREIINYRTAMYMAVDALKQRPICLNLVLDIHRVLLDSLRGRDKARGEFRRVQNYIAGNGPGIERAAFVPPEPSIVLPHIRNLEKYIHNDEEDDRLVQLAIVHAQFELIHPFVDGNGRVGRILLPLVLFEKHLLSAPIFYLSAYLNEHRDEYCDRLGAISASKDWAGRIEFFLTAVIEQARINTDKVKAIRTLYEMKIEKVRQLTHSEYTVKAVDCIFGSPIFLSTDFFNRCGIPRPTAKRILKALISEGILEILREGSGRQPAALLFAKLVKITET